MDTGSRTGVCLSTTATTGWADWFHGELWLFPDGILRVPLGWLKSICYVGYAAEQHNPKTRDFSAEEFSRLIANPRNLWIPRATIMRARLCGALRYTPLAANDLRVETVDGRLLQLLTLPKDRIYLPLESALQEWLGEAFVSDRPWWLRLRR